MPNSLILFELTYFFSVPDDFSPEKCVTIIRKQYEACEGRLDPLPSWCKFEFTLDTIHTRLEFVSSRKERGRKTDDILDMFQIFQPHKGSSQPRRVWIKGHTGMGKTTYCNKIAYDWAKKRKRGKSFPDFILVLLLKCRNINSGLKMAIEAQLLPSEMKEEQKNRFFTFIRDHQSKVLLVLDGFDKLPCGQLSIYEEIIKGITFPEFYIVVTAGHEFGEEVRGSCHTQLEVKGFTNTDAKNSILMYFQEEESVAQRLLDKLDSDRTVRDLAANPLNTTLLCLLCEDLQGNLPKSRSLLYLELVKYVLRTCKQESKEPEKDQDLMASCKDELNQLGGIAMERLKNDCQHFQESEFQGSSSNLIPAFGYLSVEGAGPSNPSPDRIYGFLHKSFQEFFAALHLCDQLHDGKISVAELLKDHRYFYEFQQVLMFTSGILAQKCEETVKALIDGIATEVYGMNFDDSPPEVALACINECKREENTFSQQIAHVFGSFLQLHEACCSR